MRGHLIVLLNRNNLELLSSGHGSPDPGDVRPEPENPEEPSPGEESEIDEESSIIL
jgi:hypothetical protein